MTIMKNIILVLVFFNWAKYLRGDEVTSVATVAAVAAEVTSVATVAAVADEVTSVATVAAVADEVTSVATVAAVAAEVHAENPENPNVNETLVQESPTQTKYVVQDPVKVMIRNINSLLVLDGSEFVVKMAPLLGTATQMWTFTRSAVNPNFIIFKNVANGRTLTSWPYTRSIFCYDWADTPYTWWKLNRDRRLVSAAYQEDYLTYGYGNMAISLRCGTASDGTDEWILVASKDNKISSGY